ncbi:hypothetical protein PIIN_06469 [Serendipita indica DSM 11827]|uniref:Uncharacterized protein n=1 Tax=Serendipita indica (strain DSM 11827) TaxID=1109443 RepID=G4TMI3_SERID|nr:hypothetical protein PIIN_06469 [Serendipita indica DSM 11827]
MSAASSLGRLTKLHFDYAPSKWALPTERISAIRVLALPVDQPRTTSEALRFPNGRARSLDVLETLSGPGKKSRRVGKRLDLSQKRGPAISNGHGSDVVEANKLEAV